MTTNMLKRSSGLLPLCVAALCLALACGPSTGEASAPETGASDVAVLQEALKSPDIGVQAAAARQLSEMVCRGNQAALPVLSRTFWGRGTGEVQEAALDVLRSASATPVVIGMMEAGVEGGGQILVKMGSAAVPGLVDEIENGHGETRNHAIYILSDMGWRAKEAVPALIRALEDGSDARVRWAAAKALLDVGGDAEVVTPALIQAVKDSDAGVSRVAIESLGRLGSSATSAVPALTEALRSRSSDVRKAAARSLAQMAPGSEDARCVLLRALGNGRGDLAYEVAQALGSVGDRIMPALIAEMKPGYIPTVSMEGLYLSFSFMYAVAVPPLVELLSDEGDTVRYWAAKALGSTDLHEEVHMRGLIRALDDEDPNVREAAVSSLATRGRLAHSAVPALKRMMIYEAPALMPVIQNALDKIGPVPKGVDYGLVKCEIESDKEGYHHYEYALSVDNDEFFLGRVRVEDKTLWPDCHGIATGSVTVKWVHPGHLLQVSWDTVSQGSGDYIARTDMLLEKENGAWWRLFRNSCQGYASGGASDSSSMEYVFDYDEEAARLTLSEVCGSTASRETKALASEGDAAGDGDSTFSLEHSWSIRTWACEIVDGVLKVWPGTEACGRGEHAFDVREMARCLAGGRLDEAARLLTPVPSGRDAGVGDVSVGRRVAPFVPWAAHRYDSGQ